jgi:hypothetical protein
MLFCGKIIGDNFPSWCNVFHGNVFTLGIGGKLACIRFLSLCNVVFGNALVLVP